MMTLARTAALLAAALALSACAFGASPKPEPLAAAPDTSLDVWPSRIQVQAAPEEIRLASHATGLTPTQARALSDFHLRWASAGGGEIVIQAPLGAPSPVQVEAQAFLIGEGTAPSLVRLAGYEAEGPAAPVIVGFLRHQAVLPDCGAYWGSLTATRENAAYYSFGCANAANLAAQVANPGDLIAPRPMAPANAQRRGGVMEAYRAGETTSSAAEPNGAGAISTAVQ